MKKLIVATFLIVGLTTFAQGKKEGKLGGEKLSVEQKVAQKVEQMKTDLNLNENQVAEVKILVEKEITKKEAARAKMKEVKKEMRPTKEENEAMKAEMKRILTPEQFEKLKKEKKEKKEDRKKERNEKK